MDIDPSYATAWVQLARAYGQISILLTKHDPRSGDLDFHGLTLQECARLNKEASERARSLDPDNARVNTDRAWARFLGGHKADAAHQFQVLIDRDPDNLDLLHALVRPLIWSGRPAEAVAVALKVDARDPLNVVNISNMAYALFTGGRVDDARSQAERAQSINPTEAYTLWLSGLICVLQGDAERALALSGRLSSDSIDSHAMRTMALHHLDRQETAEEAFATLRARWPEKRYEIAVLHAWMGDREQAFTLLSTAARDPAPEDYFGAVNTLIDPRWRPYHADPRWQGFLEATHQTEHDLAAFELDLSPLNLSETDSF